MSAIAWRLRQWTRPLGPAGLTGLALVMLALGGLFLAVRPTEQNVHVQEARLADLRAAALVRSRNAITPPDANPLAGFPPAGTASQQIGEIEQLARSHGLALPRGSYSVAPVTGTSMLRWQLVLPVSTDYPALHAFLAAALERWPNLTLDELKLRRERIEAAELQAELRLSLFVEATP